MASLFINTPFQLLNLIVKIYSIFLMGGEKKREIELIIFYKKLKILTTRKNTSFLTFLFNFINKFSA